MKTLDALISMWWSITALATLYVVLHRPHAPEVPARAEAAPASCELPSEPVMLRVLTSERDAR